MTKSFEDLFGMNACYDAVVSDVEKFNKNVFEMLGRYIIRAEQDVFFNKTMIDAVKKYINDNNIKWDYKEN